VTDDQMIVTPTTGPPVRVSVHNRGGVPLLMINGLGATLEMWRPLRAELSSRSTIALDLPGCGATPATGLPWRMGGLAELVMDVLRQLGFGRADVLGLSFGGGIAQELARRHPGAVRTLILAATGPGLGGFPGSARGWLELATPRRYHDPDHFVRVAERLYGGPPRTTAQLREEAELRQACPPSGKGYAWQLAACLGWSSLPWLRRLRMPTLILAGDDDPIVPTANARLMNCLLPDARLIVAEGAGHLFMFERPQWSAQQVDMFLSRIDDAPTASGAPR
jgi:pimeloyl-ACP methyl ester carboxylesterase